MFWAVGGIVALENVESAAQSVNEVERKRGRRYLLFLGFYKPKVARRCGARLLGGNAIGVVSVAVLSL